MHHAGWLQLDIISKYINLMAKPIIAAVNSILAFRKAQFHLSRLPVDTKTSSNNLAEMTRKGHNDWRYICWAIFYLVADDDSKMELNTQHVNLFPSFF